MGNTAKKARKQRNLTDLWIRFNGLIEAMKGIVKQTDALHQETKRATITVNILTHALVEKGILTEKDIEDATNHCLGSSASDEGSEVRPERSKDLGSNLNRDTGVLSDSRDGEDTGISVGGNQDGSTLGAE